MLAESERVYSAPPDWPKCDKYYKTNFPDKMAGGIDRLVVNGQITDQDTEQRPLVGRHLGTTAIKGGMGPFYDTRVFSDLQRFCEYHARDARNNTAAFISGGAGYDMLASHFMVNEFNFQTHHWYLEMTGRGPYYRRGMDVDVWITEQGFDYMKERSGFYPNIGVETRSRTVKNLRLLFIGERQYPNFLRFQFHTIEGSKLSPMAQCMLLAPTNLHKSGIAMYWIDFVGVDPEASLHSGPWDQKPPIHLIDAKNPLGHNRARIINGLAIYTLMTPILNEEYKDDYDGVRKYVADNLDKLTGQERKVFLEKLSQWYKQIPWSDYIADCVFKTAERLAKTGFIPKIFDWILEGDDQRFAQDFLCEILLYAEHLQIPEALDFDIESASTAIPKYRELAILIARKIDWKKI